MRILKWTKNRPFLAFLKWDEKWSQFFLFRENLLIVLNNVKRIKCDDKPSVKVCDHFSSTHGEVISPSRDVLSRMVRETAYNTLVRPQLEYSAPVWDPSSKDKRLQLEKIQRRAARWTTSNYDTRSSVTAMLNQLGWRTLEQRQVDARLCLFYKIVYGLVAVPLTNYIQPTHRISRYCH